MALAPMVFLLWTETSDMLTMLQEEIPFGTQRAKLSKGGFRLEDMQSFQHLFRNQTNHDLRTLNLPSSLDNHWAQMMSSAFVAFGWLLLRLPAELGLS